MPRRRKLSDDVGDDENDEYPGKGTSYYSQFNKAKKAMDKEKNKGNRENREKRKYYLHLRKEREKLEGVNRREAAEARSVNQAARTGRTIMDAARAEKERLRDSAEAISKRSENEEKRIRNQARIVARRVQRFEEAQREEAERLANIARGIEYIRARNNRAERDALDARDRAEHNQLEERKREAIALERRIRLANRRNADARGEIKELKYIADDEDKEEKKYERKYADDEVKDEKNYAVVLREAKNIEDRNRAVARERERKRKEDEDNFRNYRYVIDRNLADSISDYNYNRFVNINRTQPLPLVSRSENKRREEENKRGEEKKYRLYVPTRGLVIEEEIPYVPENTRRRANREAKLQERKEEEEKKRVLDRVIAENERKEREEKKLREGKEEKKRREDLEDLQDLEEEEEEVEIKDEEFGRRSRSRVPFKESYPTIDSYNLALSDNKLDNKKIVILGKIILGSNDKSPSRKKKSLYNAEYAIEDLKYMYQRYADLLDSNSQDAAIAKIREENPDLIVKLVKGKGLRRRKIPRIVRGMKRIRKVRRVRGGYY